MNKNKVKSILVKYRKNMDWLSLYEEISSVGASFVGVGDKGGMITGSQPENDAVKRHNKADEYEERKAYNEIIELVLDKLPEEERMVIDHEYNLMQNEYYNKFGILEIPVSDIVANLPFERRKYYQKLDSAYTTLKEKLSVITMHK